MFIRRRIPSIVLSDDPSQEELPKPLPFSLLGPVLNQA